MSGIESHVHVAVLQLHGLPDPSDPASGLGCAFTSRNLDTLPSSILGAGYTQRARIPLGGISGEGYQADLREPGAAGGSWSVTLDDPDDGLCRLFEPSPSSREYLLEHARISASETAIEVTGDDPSEPPIVGDLLWLGSEALEVTAVSTLTAQRWALTVERGKCGSIAAEHKIVPSRDWLSGGAADRLSLRTEPDLLAGRWLATLTLLRLLPGGPELSRRVYCVLSGTPRPGERGTWTVDLLPIASLLDLSPVPGVEVEPLRLVEVLATAPSRTDPAVTVAARAALWLSGQEASRLFDEHLMTLGSFFASSAALSVVASRLSGSASPRVAPHLDLEIGGGRYSYRVSGVTLARPAPTGSAGADGALPLVRVALDLVADDGTPITTDDPPISTLAQEAGGGEIVRYGNGWVLGYGGLIGAPEERSAKVRLRLLLRATPAETLCLLATGQTLTGVPALWGAQHAEIPASMLGIGSVASDSGTVSKASRELAKLDQIMIRHTIPVDASTRAGDVLSDLLRLYCALLTPLSDGALTLSVWARPYTGTVSIVPVAGAPLLGGASLTPIVAYELRDGRHPLTWETTTVRTATARSARALRGEVQAVRIYAEGNASAPQVTGLVGEMLRLFALTFGGPRTVLTAEISPYVVLTPGDQVEVTAREVPTFAGRGVTAARYIVIGVDLDWATGEQAALLLADAANREEIGTAGDLAPALRVLSLAGCVASGGVARVLLRVAGELADGDDLDLRTAYGGIFATLAGEGRTLRVVSYPAHAPALSATEDRPGLRECYGAVLAVGPDWISLAISTDYERAGLTIPDYLPWGSAGVSWVLLPDLRADTPIGPISPAPEAGYSGGEGRDFARVTLPRSRRHTLIA